MFREEAVVYTYTDQDALRDGVLVNVSGTAPFPINRVTRAVWEAFTSPMGRMPGRLGGSPVTDVTRLSRLGDLIAERIRTGQTPEDMVVLEYEEQRVWGMPNGTHYGGARPHAEGWTILFPEDY